MSEQKKQIDIERAKTDFEYFCKMNGWKLSPLQMKIASLYASGKPFTVLVPRISSYLETRRLFRKMDEYVDKIAGGKK